MLGSSQQEEVDVEKQAEYSTPASSNWPVTNEPAKPRLIITKIVQRNFKSYAGVVEIGPFHKVSTFLLII